MSPRRNSRRIRVERWGHPGPVVFFHGVHIPGILGRRLHSPGPAFHTESGRTRGMDGIILWETATAEVSACEAAKMLRARLMTWLRRKKEGRSGLWQDQRSGFFAGASKLNDPERAPRRTTVRHHKNTECLRRQFIAMPKRRATLPAQADCCSDPVSI